MPLPRVVMAWCGLAVPSPIVQNSGSSWTSIAFSLAFELAARVGRWPGQFAIPIWACTFLHPAQPTLMPRKHGLEPDTMARRAPDQAGNLEADVA